MWVRLCKLCGCRPCTCIVCPLCKEKKEYHSFLSQPFVGYENRKNVLDVINEFLYWHDIDVLEGMCRNAWTRYKRHPETFEEICGHCYNHCLFRDMDEKGYYKEWIDFYIRG